MGDEIKNYSELQREFHEEAMDMKYEGMKISGEIETGIKMEPDTESHERYLGVISNSDSDLQEEFHAMMENVKCEETDIATKHIEPVGIETVILSEKYEIPRSEQSLEVPEVISGLTDVTAFPYLCRLCATRSTNAMVYIFGPYKLQKNIIKQIEYCLPITVTKNDTLSKQVCQLCLDKLELCYQFHKTVAHAEKQLLMRDEEKCFGWDANNDESTTITNDTTVENDVSLSNPRHYSKGSRSNETNHTNNPDRVAGSKSSSHGHQSTDASIDYSASHIEYGISHSPIDIPVPIVHSEEELRHREYRNRNKGSKFYSRLITSQSDRASEKRRKNARKDNDDNDVNDVNDVVFSGAKPLAGQYVDSEIINCRICGGTLKTKEKWGSQSSNHPSCLCDEGLATKKGQKKHCGLGETQCSQLSTEKNFSCVYCAKTFRQKVNLVIHTRIHTGERPYVCDFCGKTFTARGSRDGHRRIHTGERPYVCDFCGKTFMARGSRDGHRRSHTGERPYVCDFCGKTFTARGSRDGHRRIHTGERFFECSICGKSFLWRTSMKNHMSAHSEDRPHNCLVCDKSFKTTSARRRHMLVHSDLKPYECNLCGTLMKRKRLMGRHQKSRICLKKSEAKNEAQFRKN